VIFLGEGVSVNDKETALMSDSRSMLLTASRSGNLAAHSFQENPVLVIENFWSAEERQYFVKR
jgi:hypothetical protein